MGVLFRQLSDHVPVGVRLQKIVKHASTSISKHIIGNPHFVQYVDTLWHEFQYSSLDPWGGLSKLKCIFQQAARLTRKHLHQDCQSVEYQLAECSKFYKAAVNNDLWLKKYTTALFKRQWGLNLIKFEGVQLPGGTTLNGRQIFDDATTELQLLDDEIYSKYQLPDDFMVG